MESPGAADFIREMKALGGTVEVVACDLRDRRSVEAVVWGIGEDHPLDVVCHLAGRVDDALLASLTLDRFDDVMGPKRDGAWNLHRATQHLSLRGFILYSSIAGMLGNAGQANYAAANAALESLVRLRRQNHLAATVIHWGPWAGGGMVDDVLQNHLRSRGVHLMDPVKALQAMDLGMAGDPASVGIFDIDWSQFASADIPEKIQNLLQGVPEALSAFEEAEATESQVQGSKIRDALRTMPEHMRFNQIRSVIRKRRRFSVSRRMLVWITKKVSWIWDRFLYGG